MGNAGNGQPNRLKYADLHPYHPPVEPPTKRRCLGPCGMMFMSMSKTNRICPVCSGRVTRDAETTDNERRQKVYRKKLKH